MSGDVRKVKKDKEIVVELECQIRDIGQQFMEQMKSLDHRLEIFLGVVLEMQDYYRKQSEAQAEYARNLEKISRQITLRHRDNKQKRESWVGYSGYQAWQGLVNSTRQTSKDYAALSELLNGMASARLGEIGEDMQRIYRKCREVAISCQADISKVLSEVLNAMKTYHQYHGDSQVAENKLLRVQSQKVKVDQQSGLAKKFVNYEKKSEKKQAKYVENKLKALKARNEYLLCVDIANAAVRKYFEEDFPRMVRKMDAGYHSMVSQVLEIHAGAQKILSERENARVVGLSVRAKGVQGPSDYENFYTSCQRVFQLPGRVEFQSHRGDEVTQICSQKPVLDEILVRLDQISIRLNKEKENKAEAMKAFEQNEKVFFERLRLPAVGLEQFFSDDRLTMMRSPTDKQREDKLRVEDAFVEMYKDNLLRDNLIVRLQTKYDSLRKSLGENATERITAGYRPPSLPPKPKKKVMDIRPGREGPRPKLFGGSIEEYVEATGEAIPSIMRSCIKVINSYGMSHQGIFRVSGSVNEMMNYKAMFEQGEDPLVHKMDGDDINTVAGLLKLYLRELREPLFPSQYYDAMVKCAEAMYPNDGEKDWKEMLREILSNLSPQRIVIMRYLFAFLSHVTEYSDENMMEAFNLSICFGPTLVMPPPERNDQHQYQGLINDLVKNVIVNYEEIYPPATQEDYENKAVYEKFLSADFLGSTSDDDGLKGVVNEEDEDFDEREAVVEEDYKARTDEELTCVKGDTVSLVRKEGNDFWTVEHQNRVGLLPERVLSAKRSQQSILRKLHNLNKSTECLMTADFGSQSNPSLAKASSNQNVSENGLQVPSSSATTQNHHKFRASNVSLQSVNKSSSAPAAAAVEHQSHCSLLVGLDSILARVQHEANSFNPSQQQQQQQQQQYQHQQQQVSTSNTRYQQTLVPVLPPLPHASLQTDPSSVSVRSSLAALKKRNTSFTSDLDVVVTPPSPSEDQGLPALPCSSHEPIGGKLSSPIVGQNKPPVTIASKWNSLPHNIPPIGSVPVSIPSVPASNSPVLSTHRSHASSVLVSTSGSTFQVPRPAPSITAIQSSTLPRQSDKQSSVPPTVRAKPTVPTKKRISMEDRKSTSPETIPKQPPAQQQVPPNLLNTFGRPVKPAEPPSPGSTFLSSIEDNGTERTKFSSFKISPSLQKKQ